MFSYLGNNRERGLFEDFDSLQREIEQLFGGGSGNGIRSGRAGAYPPLNVGVTAEEVHVYVFAPGLTAADFAVTLQKNLLTVAGARKIDTPEDSTWYLRERFEGDFRRVVTLPEDVDPDQVAANYRDGVLHLAIKRRAAVRPRQISIN